MARREPKIEDVTGVVREILGKGGRWVETEHARMRMKERRISRMEVRYVLANGGREKRKDEYCDVYGEWKYAIRGRTLDKDRDLRVIICLNSEGILLITAIELGA